jgi:hypothetical protein
MQKAVSVPGPDDEGGSTTAEHRRPVSLCTKIGKFEIEYSLKNA